MKKLKAIRNTLLMLASAAVGAVFGPGILHNKEYMKPECVQERLEVNLEIMKLWLDQQHGEGFFDALVKASGKDKKDVQDLFED